MEQIRVLHVIGNSKFGGASDIILELCRMAKRHGFEVDVLATDPNFGEAVQNAGIGLVALEGINREIRPWKDLAALFRLWRYLCKNSYTIVHTHTSKGGFIGRLAARMAGVPVILHTAHGFAIHEASPIYQKLSYALLERIAAACCDAVVYVSRFHRAWGARLHLAPFQKMQAIPNGIRPQRLEPTLTASAVRRSLELPPETLLLFCPSRLAPQKGIEHLLRAVDLLKGTMTHPFHLFIAGDGPARGKYEELARHLGLSSYVTFLGFRNDIPNLLAAADIAVLPSIREGMSLALLEAMAASKPIVATAIGSNREVQGALLVEPASPSELADAITRLAEDHELASRLGAYAGAVLRNRYTERRMIDDYWHAYCDLLSRKRIVVPPIRTAGLEEDREEPAGIASVS